MSESDPDRVEEEIANAIRQLPQKLQQEAAQLPFPVLHHACMTGHLELVRGLLDAGVPVDLYPETEDEDDQPPLTWLARDRAQAAANALEVARLLIEHCEDLDEGSPLAAALEACDVSMVRLLLSAGAEEELARGEVGSSEELMLDALLEPYWAAPVAADPQYFLAFNAQRAICGVGMSQADAKLRARPNLDEQPCESMMATERLIAAFLRGEELLWTEHSGVADLDDH